MTKRNGTYYLQYSGPGTQWKTYAVGYYTSSSQLGPFTYYPGSPILVHNKGLINGVGHHSVIDAPDGTLWAFFNILYENLPGGLEERRIGMDPVEFDEDGNMNILGPTRRTHAVSSGVTTTGSSTPRTGSMLAKPMTSSSPSGRLSRRPSSEA